MWGQWIGKAKGGNNGFIMLNIDKNTPNRGHLTFDDFDPIKPSFICEVEVLKSSPKNRFAAELTNFKLNHPNLTPDQVKPYQVALPSHSCLEGVIKDQAISGSFNSNNSQKGSFEIFSEENYQACKADYQMDWTTFLKFSLDLKRKKPGVIFRGMESSGHALKTSFHRHDRRNLVSYIDDIRTLAHHLTSFLGRSFDLSNPQELTEVLFLGQHHGFPTPLLDWTDSPFVAAYFAFHKHPKGLSKKGKARILCFHKDEWEKKYDSATHLLELRPTFAPYTISCRDNPRAIPQQSVVTYSNIYNIEDYVQFKAKTDKQIYLEVIDIELSERDNIMKDLEAMGITASSLFPSLDGISQYLREKRF